jgi:hypothetical protein
MDDNKKGKGFMIFGQQQEKDVEWQKEEIISVRKIKAFEK